MRYPTASCCGRLSERRPRTPAATHRFDACHAFGVMAVDADPRWRQSESGYGCNAARRMDPPPRSPATEADDCFMVRIQRDPTEYKLGRRARRVEDTPRACGGQGGLPSDQQSPCRPIAGSMPPCSRPSRNGLEALAPAAPSACRPSLTATRHDGATIMWSEECTAGVEQKNGPQKGTQIMTL